MPKLSRDFDERKALVRGLINALIRNDSIETTEAKARAIQGLVDKLVTKAKKGGHHNFTYINSILDDETNSQKLVDTIAPNSAGHKGGYTRITKLGTRKGDNAMIVRIEFTGKAGEPKKVKKVAKK